jgi:hypothetical protein
MSQNDHYYYDHPKFRAELVDKLSNDEEAFKKWSTKADLTEDEINSVMANLSTSDPVTN